MSGHARSNCLVNRRLLQFSLRGLLCFAAFACLLLGGWRWLEEHGTYISAVNPKVGEPIRIKARHFCLFGPPKCYLELGYEMADGSALSDGTFGRGRGDAIERACLCLYSMEYEFDPLDRPCQLRVFFRRQEKPWGQQTGTRAQMLQEKIVDVN